jgi:AcrR family transcriptional regulator
MDTKEHIMHVGMQLFAEKGYETTTIRDIAAKAKVNLALISYHFGSKEGLLKNIFQQRALNLQFHIWEISNDKNLNELEKVHLMIEYYIDKIFTNHQFHRVMMRELFSSQSEEVHSETIDIFTENAKIVISIIEKGIKKKVFRKTDPELCFASIIGTIHHLMHSKILRTRIFGGKEIKDPILEPSFKKRVTKHIQQMIEHHLIDDKNNNN